MVIRNRRQVLLFAIVTTIVALVTAEIMNLLLFPPEILLQTMTGTAVIVITVCMPICLWVGEKMFENASLSAELQNLVNRDRLTDVATRDFFFAQMEDQPDAYGVSLMVDIDRFKDINDKYGHLAGDRVIQAVAQALQENTRAQDIVCRFGGEEFVVFLDRRAMADGFDVAERLRETVAEKLVRFDEKDINVTVSIGGSLKERISDINTAIKAADAALYRAKTSGRNRTIFDADNAQPIRAIV